MNYFFLIKHCHTYRVLKVNLCCHKIIYTPSPKWKLATQFPCDVIYGRTLSFFFKSSKNEPKTLFIGTRDDRLRKTLIHMGPAVLNGGFSTFLSIVLLCNSNSHVFITFFKVSLEGNPTKLLPVFLASKLGHFIVRTILMICYEYSSLTSTIGKREKWNPKLPIF